MKQFFVSYAIKSKEIICGFGGSIVTSSGKLSVKDLDKVREDVNKELNGEVAILAISELTDTEE